MGEFDTHQVFLYQNKLSLQQILRARKHSDKDKNVRKKIVPHAINYAINNTKYFTPLAPELKSGKERETLSVQENDSCDHFVLITQNKQFVAV